MTSRLDRLCPSTIAEPTSRTVSGVVSTAGYMSGYGRLIVLRHGRTNVSTYYAHLSECFVRPHQMVRRGQVIGRVGRSGRTTSAHLHYEVRLNHSPQNPVRYLKRNFREFALVQPRLGPRL